MKVLIAEDDPVARAVLARILGGLPNYQLTLAEDGTIAWALLDDPARSFDLVFLDINMPGMDGFEILRRIAESPVLKSVKVVLCTAAHDRASVVKAAQLGARHYIVKPADPAVVLAKLRQIEQPNSGNGNTRHP